MMIAISFWLKLNGQTKASYVENVVVQNSIKGGLRIQDDVHNVSMMRV